MCPVPWAGYLAVEISTTVICFSRSSMLLWCDVTFFIRCIDICLRRCQDPEGALIMSSWHRWRKRWLWYLLRWYVEGLLSYLGCNGTSFFHLNLCWGCHWGISRLQWRHFYTRWNHNLVVFEFMISVEELWYWTCRRVQKSIEIIICYFLVDPRSTCRSKRMHHSWRDLANYCQSPYNFNTQELSVHFGQQTCDTTVSESWIQKLLQHDVSLEKDAWIPNLTRHKSNEMFSDIV